MGRQKFSMPVAVRQQPNRGALIAADRLAPPGADRSAASTLKRSAPLPSRHATCASKAREEPGGRQIPPAPKMPHLAHQVALGVMLALIVLARIVLHVRAGSMISGC